MPAGSARCLPALLLLLSSVPLWAAEISCRNEDGETVDWFALYKLPKHTKGQIPMLGLEYLYMGALAPQWQLGKYLINMTQSALGQTLQQLYETYESKRNTTAYAIYNDEIPESDSKGWKCGHTKGFLLLDKSQGFWVIHSVPLFPPIPEDGYGYPSTGESFGQTAICITFKYDQFTEIDQQMLSYNPGVYSCSIPDIFQADLPNLQKLCAKSRLPSVPVRRLSKLQSAHGETFLHFAKSHLFIDDIYVAWMAQELKTDLLAESWQRSGEKLYSNCSLDYHVYNINDSQGENEGADNFAWSIVQRKKHCTANRDNLCSCIPSCSPTCQKMGRNREMGAKRVCRRKEEEGTRQLKAKTLIKE
uniref:deoxyribonuclease II n=1 Tax=Corvus moneduloides TaxID=1196302 RepID=A0A8C3E0L5_CORMO